MFHWCTSCQGQAYEVTTSYHATLPAWYLQHRWFLTLILAILVWHRSTGPMFYYNCAAVTKQLALYLDPPVTSERSPSASCSWCSCLGSGSGTSHNLWSWFRPSPATAAAQKLAPGASSPWPVQSPVWNKSRQSCTKTQQGKKKNASVIGTKEN